MSTFDSRISGYGTEDPEQLLANPQNWRKHPQAQQNAMQGVLEEVGWVTNVIVNEVTGHVLDGHMRIQVAMRNGEREVPVTYVNLTEEEERIVLATYDPLGAMAQQDSKQLADLLAGIQDRANEDLQALLDKARQSALGGMTMDHTAKIVAGEATGRDSTQMMQEYTTTSVRQITLIFNEEDYLTALKIIKQLMDHTGEPTSAKAILWLLLAFEEDEGGYADDDTLDASFTELG